MPVVSVEDVEAEGVDVSELVLAAEPDWRLRWPWCPFCREARAVLAAATSPFFKAVPMAFRGFDWLVFLLEEKRAGASFCREAKAV